MITVLMPLFNCASYVRQAISSILDQSYADFELLIIDDGSDDAGPEMVEAIPDARLVFLRNPHNMGVAATLNRGLEIAQGRYIVRMDADDISLPDRLVRQVQYMDEHPEVGISGGGIRLFGFGFSHTLSPPCEPEILRCYALFENPLCHMSVIMRREMMHAHGLRYDRSFSRSEDYELWSRSLRCFPIANIDRVLVDVRQHPASATLANWQEMTSQTETIQAGLLSALGVTPDREEQILHHQVGRGYRQHDMAQIFAGERWLLHLRRCNLSTGFADASTFAATTSRIWLRFCTNSTPLGPMVWRCWRDSPLRSRNDASTAEKLRLVASILWHRFRPSWMPDHLSAGESQRRKGQTG